MSRKGGINIAFAIQDTQDSLQFLSWACESKPHLKIKIAVDCIRKSYASHAEVAEFLGVALECWEQFYANYQVGDISRLPSQLKDVIDQRDWRYFSGFTDEQLEILGKISEVPMLMNGKLHSDHSLYQELRVLMGFGVIQAQPHDQFERFSLNFFW